MFSFIWTVIAAVVGAYYGSYLREKGKNRATSEDIDQLTRSVEDVKTANAKQLAELSHQNSLLIEQLKSRQQLRLAAIDKRLQAHQEAFSYWRKILAAVHGEDIGKVVIECQTWWEQNSLYLEPQVRDAFNRAYHSAAGHRSLVDVRHRDDSAVAAVRENWNLIMAAGNIIMEAVELPAVKSEMRVQGPRLD
jgi:hypothetical protein